MAKSRAQQELKKLTRGVKKVKQVYNTKIFFAYPSEQHKTVYCCSECNKFFRFESQLREHANLVKPCNLSKHIAWKKDKQNQKLNKKKEYNATYSANVVKPRRLLKKDPDAYLLHRIQEMQQPKQNLPNVVTQMWSLLGEFPHLIDRIREFHVGPRTFS